MSQKFSQRVYALLKKIPIGKVTTYKAIANKLGTKAYRAVGSALNKNQNAPKVPCHRVINSDGRLGGYVFGVEKKKSLLISEGVQIENNKIDLKKFNYSFSTKKT